MSKVIELTDQERELVDRFFTENPLLVRKYAGKDNQYLGDIWEAAGRAVKGYKPENGDFINYAGTIIWRTVCKAYKSETIFTRKKDKKSDSESTASFSEEFSKENSEEQESAEDDVKKGRIISIIPFKGDDPDSGGSASASTPPSPEEDVEYYELVKIVEESLPSRDSQIVCLLCSRLYDSGNC
jgi:hypothetical protein